VSGALGSTLLKEDVVMRTALDFSPLYRSTVGFDRLFDMLDSSLNAAEPTHANWPSYNIERLGDDHYRITMAVAEVYAEVGDGVRGEAAYRGGV
jgi:HSP20 family molecular chaperone IbpA